MQFPTLHSSPKLSSTKMSSPKLPSLSRLPSHYSRISVSLRRRLSLSLRRTRWPTRAGYEDLEKMSLLVGPRNLFPRGEEPEWYRL